MIAKSDNVTPRERFLAIMRYEPVERLPVLALEPFETTAREMAAGRIARRGRSRGFFGNV